MTNEMKIELIQKLQNDKPVEEPKKKGFFQRIKESIEKAQAEERALEASDPIAYRQMKAMERMANNQSINQAEIARMQGVQQSQNAMMRAALMSNNQQFMRNALFNSLN